MNGRLTLPYIDYDRNREFTWVIYSHPGALEQDHSLDNQRHGGVTNGHKKGIG